MRVVFLVPRRKDNGWRDRVWDLCRRRWEHLFPSWPIYEGHHNSGPFNRAWAINEAARLADVRGRWDIGIVIDADVMLPQRNVQLAVERARKSGRVVWAHRRWRGFNEESTEHLLRPKGTFAEGALGKGGILAPEFAADMDLLVERTTALSWSCCIAIPRQAWETVGGFDARFRGWGFEDMAFQAMACGLVGHDRIEGDVYHLWHPRTPGLGTASKQGKVYTREAVVNARLGRRYMVALRRDYGITDRPEKSTAEAIERDIANLKRDDAKLAAAAQQFGLADWSDWWPTLEELRASWESEQRVVEERAHSITAILHTGGEPETWPDRSAYLRASLASFTKQVTGPIVQRVIYSDWDDGHRGELEEIALKHGFYVVGEGHHGYTASMRRMWHYLAKRARGDYILLLEDDFTYSRPVELQPMIDVLNANPHLAQIALLREAYYPRELAAAGILGWPQESFTPAGRNGVRWIEHRNFFTANPSLFRRNLTDRPWPLGPSSERIFGDALTRDPLVRFAFWGSGESWIAHIGETRAGSPAAY